MKPTLLVLAAGLGSRYGGLKQIDAVGPRGEAIIDYSIYDALQAGFGKIVFVIRHDIEAAFKEAVGDRFSKQAPVDYAFQELDMLPDGFTVPPGRTKPWGTAHAVICAEPVVRENFAVINADDFYGADSYRVLAAYLRTAADRDGVGDYAMVGFILRHTLSDHGSVSRALCEVDADQNLQSIVELTKIERDGPNGRYQDEAGAYHPLRGDDRVSMNMFGFTPSAFANLREQFVSFLATRGQEPKAEFFIPTPLNRLLQARRARMKVLATSSPWFGITYREDKPAVVEQLRRLIAAGAYPDPLWP